MQTPTTLKSLSILSLLLALVAGGSPQVFGQDMAQAQQADIPLKIDLDYASFAYGPDNSLVEFYLAFEAASLVWVSDTEGGFRAEVPVDMAVVRPTQTAMSDAPSDPIWDDNVSLNFVLPDTSGLAEGQHFIHQIRAALPPGEYQLTVGAQTGADPDTRSLSLRRDVVVPDFSGEGSVNMSDVTLASVIQQSDNKDDLFYKNGLVIRPNANQLFGSGLNVMFFYFEVYNLDAMDTAGDSYTAFMYIAEANVPQPLPDFQKRANRQIRSTDVVANSFNISTLPSGSYFLRIAILNEENEAVAEQSRKFFIYNPNVQRPEPEVMFEESFETSRYATMSEEEISRMEEHADVIATDQERRRLKSLQDLEERRRFLMEFWRIRDPEPNTPINEFQEGFYTLVQYANDRYSSRQMEGWKTDRGRTILKYGTPSNVQPHLFDRGYRPYEIWEYNNIAGEGRSQFVFADLDGFGLFELINSTVTGERKLTNWLEELEI